MCITLRENIGIYPSDYESKMAKFVRLQIKPHKFFRIKPNFWIARSHFRSLFAKWKIKITFILYVFKPL